MRCTQVIEKHAISPRTEDDFSIRAGGIRLALVHKLDARRNHVACRALFILEQNPRHGRGNNNVEVLARACLV
jgi:hypothetical protein